MFKTILFLLLALYSFAGLAQSQFPAYYAAYFTDKSNNTYSITQPQQFMSQRALDRYQKNTVLITQQDLPVTQSYLDSILKMGAKVHSHSKWMNAALVIVNDTNQLMNLDQFPFVNKVKYLAPFDTLYKKKGIQIANTVYETKPNTTASKTYGKSFHQIDMLGATQLHQNGMDGTGVHIAVLDAGFWAVDKTHAFDSLRAHNGILTVRDIVHPGNDVYYEGTHGALVLSTMAALLPGEYRGSACGASYHLIRTETTNSEYPVEEFHWLVGAELADSLGADIITSSLGYRTFDDSTLNYTHADLNGQVAIISIAAHTAATKGILVFNSAGNDGQALWRKIGFPADAEDILTVGAVDSLEQLAPFSSVGYTADGRIKPDLVAMGQGTQLVSANDDVFPGNGTSFSTPLLAGAAALLFESNPNVLASDILKALNSSAHQYQNPDSLMGYGIPNIFLADLILKQLNIPTINTDEHFKIIPNPFSSSFHIVYEASDNQKINIEIFDITGKQVWSCPSFEQTKGPNLFYISNLDDLEKGMYFLRIEGKEKVYTRKLIKHQ